MTCLDTSFLIELFHGSDNAKLKYEKLQNHMEQQDRLCTTIVNYYELTKSAVLTKDPERNLQLVHELLSELTILQLDPVSVDTASELYSSLAKKGRMIGEFDILIAAICISNSEELVTNDAHFASVTNLIKQSY